MSRHVCAAGTCGRVLRSVSGSRRREIKNADSRNDPPSTQIASDSRLPPSPASAEKPPSQWAIAASAANITAPSGNVPNAATRPSELAEARCSGSFTMLGTLASFGRSPQQREHLDRERQDHEAPDVLPERQHREQSGPADVARDHHGLAVPAVDERAADRREQEAGEHAGDHHEADRGRRVRDAAGDREDREEPGPVAEARRELRAEERKEPGNAEHAPRRRRDRIVVGCRRYERRARSQADQPRETFGPRRCGRGTLRDGCSTAAAWPPGSAASSPSSSRPSSSPS